LAKVPTAPEIAQVAISSRAAISLVRAREFGVGQSELEAEGHRLGVDAVRAADGRRQFVFIGAALQRGEQRVDVGDQDVAGATELHREAGVEHVGAGHALMDEARVGADELGQMSEEGDDVVLGHLLDRVDALDVERHVARLFPDRFRRFFRDDADLGQRVAGVSLDLEPDAEARFGRPDLDHLGAGIAGDHRRFLGRGPRAVYRNAAKISTPLRPRRQGPQGRRASWRPDAWPCSEPTLSCWALGSSASRRRCICRPRAAR
jgi:hypothetical protein